MNKAQPLVAVITPVYNGEKYLAECIESIIKQNYGNWEYVIVNNCSSDSTLDIVTSYAKNDSRIKVVSNSEFVGVIENHNIAFNSISPHSKYCKVVSADDWLYPECIARLVEVAEENPSVGIVGSYQLSGGGDKWDVKWVGLPYSSTVVSGRDICRSTLLGGKYIFGCPTSVLYRSDLIRGVDSFFTNLTPQADVSAFYEYLQNTDFGFVHQVISFERIHNDAVSSQCRKIVTNEPSVLRDLLEYGLVYLSESELECRLNAKLMYYYEMLAYELFHFRGKDFWDYHKRRISELGYSLYNVRFAKLVCMKVMDYIFNPMKTMEKILRRLKN